MCLMDSWSKYLLDTDDKAVKWKVLSSRKSKQNIRKEYTCVINVKDKDYANRASFK